MSLQIQSKFIADSAIDGEKLLLSSGQAVKIVDADGNVIRLIELDEASGKVLVNGVAVALEPALLQEIADRAAADTQVATAAQALIQAEAEARVLDVNTEETRALAAEAVLSAAISAEEAARIADVNAEESRAMAAESALDARLDVLEGPNTQAGSVAKALKDAKDYTDSRVADVLGAVSPDIIETLTGLQNALNDGDATTGLLDAIAAEKSARESADSSLQSQITGFQSEMDATQAGAGLSASGSYVAPVSSNYLSAATSLKDADSKLDAAIKVVADDVAQEILDRAAAVSAEQARAEAAELALQGEVDAVETALAQELLDRAAADTTLQGEIDAEETRALAAEAALDARLDVLEGADTVTGSVAKALKDAKAYTDSEIATEASVRQSADNALDGRLDVLEARQHRKMKFVLSAQDITNGYVELAHEAMVNSVVAAVGRLMIHEGASDDFTVSVVSGVSRLTFVGNLIEPGQEKLAAGDVLFVKYVNI